MRRLLEAIRQTLGGTPQASNTTVPPQVQNFAAATKAGGTLLTWDLNLNGGYYLLYRGITNDLSSAYTVGIITEGNTRRGQFLDPCGQNTAATLIYYWIQPYTLAGIPGPVSMVTKAAVDCANHGLLAFSDTFADSAGSYAGTPWIWSPTPMNSIASSDLDAAINLSANTIAFGNSLLNLANMHVAFFPSTIDLAAVQAASLLGGISAKCTVVSNSGSTTAGPAVCINTPTYCHYMLELIVGTASRLRRYTGLTTASIVNLANGFVPSANDIVELDVIYSGTIPTLNIYRNGVFQSTYVDSDAGRIQNGGWYGMAIHNFPASTNAVLSTFVGATL